MEIDTHAAILPHGQKRQSDDDLDSDQPLAKRFNLLNLDPATFAENASKLYIPVGTRPAPMQRKRSNAVNIDNMNVDETSNRVYIHDLDAEIADMESDEEKLVFIPDIDKKLMKIPKSVLLGKKLENTSNEVVLYGVPESLSVPEEHDVVRKAISEARARAREQQAHTEEDMLNTGTLAQRNGFGSRETSQLQPAATTTQDRDEDAMDMG